MRLKRRLPLFLAVLLVAATLFAVVQLRRHAPPEPARLLPGADAFLYVNFKWIRTLDGLSELPPVLHEQEYERFIQETGFQFERDLDEAAFAVHYPANWGNGATGGSAPQPRFSEVFVGKFQGERLTQYLRKLAGSVDDYHGTDIYSIPLEGRTLRVAILTVDSVAASNHDNPAVIRGMVDRCHKLASPFAGPALLRQNYKSVPLASLAWGIAKVQPASSGTSFGGWSLLFQKPARVVVSARYLGAVHLRAEAFTENGDDAQVLTDRVSTFLNLFHAAESSAGTSGPDPDVKAFFDSLGVTRHGDRAVLTASVPAGFLKKVLSEPPQEVAPTPAAPGEQPPAVPEPAKHEKAVNTPK